LHSFRIEKLGAGAEECGLTVSLIIQQVINR
jgi:hypothetical protein